MQQNFNKVIFTFVNYKSDDLLGPGNIFFSTTSNIGTGQSLVHNEPYLQFLPVLLEVHMGSCFH